MRIDAIRTRRIREGEDLSTFIASHIPKIENGTVLVIASKIVSWAEGRRYPDASTRSLIRLIRKESETAVRSALAWLTFKNGMAMVNAGIDSSNGDGKLVLLPNDPYKTAARTRLKLLEYYRVKKLGIVIADSSVVPLRMGTIGMALGFAGIRGTRDYRKKRDLFGRKFRMTKTNIADALAASAVLLMGEGNERRPLAVVRDAPVEFVDRTNRNEMVIAPKNDLFAPLFKHLKK